MVQNWISQRVFNFVKFYQSKGVVFLLEFFAHLLVFEGRSRYPHPVSKYNYQLRYNVSISLTKIEKKD